MNLQEIKKNRLSEFEMLLHNSEHEKHENGVKITYEKKLVLSFFINHLSYNVDYTLDLTKQEIVSIFNKLYDYKVDYTLRFKSL